MTYEAENSYYTPEGIIPKRRYEGAAVKTPDRTFGAETRKRASSSTVQRRGFDSAADSAAETLAKRIASSSGTRPSHSRSHSIDSSSVKLSSQGTRSSHGIDSSSGNLKMGTGTSAGSSRSGYGHPYERSRNSGTRVKSKKKPYLIFVFVVFILSVVFPLFGTLGSFDGGNDCGFGGNDSGSEYDDSEFVTVSKTVQGQGYTLTLEQIMNDPADDNLSVVIFMTAKISDDKNITIYPYKCMSAEFDGVKQQDVWYVSVTNYDTDEDYLLTDPKESVTMKKGETVSVAQTGVQRVGAFDDSEGGVRHLDGVAQGHCGAVERPIAHGSPRGQGSEHLVHETGQVDVAVGCGQTFGRALLGPQEEIVQGDDTGVHDATQACGQGRLA